MSEHNKYVFAYC